MSPRQPLGGWSGHWKRPKIYRSKTNSAHVIYQLGPFIYYYQAYIQHVFSSSMYPIIYFHTAIYLFIFMLLFIYFHAIFIYLFLCLYLFIFMLIFRDLFCAYIPLFLCFYLFIFMLICIYGFSSVWVLNVNFCLSPKGDYVHICTHFCFGTWWFLVNIFGHILIQKKTCIWSIILRFLICIPRMLIEKLLLLPFL